MNAREGATEGAEASGRGDGSGSVTGVVFVLAGGKLRHMSCAGEGFLGYSAGEIFWQDLFEMVHEGDLPLLEALVFDTAARPGVSRAAKVSVRDAAGGWRTVEATAINVLEAPGDGGLLAVNARDLSGSRGYPAALGESLAS